MSIMHEVEDYSSWKAVFDHAAGIRKEAGEIVYQLLHYDRDANTIVHLSEWPSLHNAGASLNLRSCRDLGRTAGVQSRRFIYLQE
jgi:hypothetical protein